MHNSTLSQLHFCLLNRLTSIFKGIKYDPIASEDLTFKYSLLIIGKHKSIFRINEKFTAT